MFAATSSDQPAQSRGLAQKVQSVLVALMFATSFFARFEPSPMDVFFVLATVASLHNGMRIPMAIMPLFLFLLIYGYALQKQVDVFVLLYVSRPLL